MTDVPPDPPPQGGRADLVLEGGGVRGVALVGAVRALADAGYSFPRVGGASAGGFVAALVAGLQAAGEPLSRLDDVAAALDYRKVPDRSGASRVPLIGDALALLLHDGIYTGAYAEGFLRGVLADLGVRTFGDLVLPAAEVGDLPPSHRYRLVVVASDLSRRRLVRLPWDDAELGLPPDEQDVAEAVRASAAIPYFFRPVRLRAPALPGGRAVLVDGGLLSDYPVTLFDRTDGRPPRWPTFGVRLSARHAPPLTYPVRGPVSLGLAAGEALFGARDAQHVDDPCGQERTVFIDTSFVSPLDFAAPAATLARLRAGGSTAAQAFLSQWSFPDYLARCRGGPDGVGAGA